MFPASGSSNSSFSSQNRQLSWAQSRDCLCLRNPSRGNGLKRKRLKIIAFAIEFVRIPNNSRRQTRLYMIIYKDAEGFAACSTSSSRTFRNLKETPQDWRSAKIFGVRSFFLCQREWLSRKKTATVTAPCAISSLVSFFSRRPFFFFVFGLKSFGELNIFSLIVFLQFLVNQENAFRKKYVIVIA